MRLIYLQNILPNNKMNKIICMYVYIYIYIYIYISDGMGKIKLNCHMLQ